MTTEVAVVGFLGLCGYSFARFISSLPTPGIQPVAAEASNKPQDIPKRDIPGELLEADTVPGDQYFADMNRKYGNIFTVSFLGESFIVLAGKKGLDFFKQNERKYFQVKGSSPESWDGVILRYVLTLTSELYGTSNPILTAPESTHKLFRRACTNAMMSLKSVEDFYPHLTNILDSFLDTWSTGTIHSTQLAIIAFSISWVWVFGERGEKAKEMFQLFHVFVDALSAPVCYDPDSPYGRGLAARAEIVSHFQEIYQGPPSETIPNLFQTFHEYISQEDAPGTEGYSKKMSDLLVGVLFAAYHAISMSLNGALWEIGTKPYLQEELRQEIIHSKKNRHSESLSKHLPLAELSRLPLLNNFVNEVLRLYNAGFGIYRLTVESFEFDGYKVPKGAKVFVFCGYDHYNVSCPFSFDPWRDHSSYQWIPFGAGSRSCMGQKFAITEIKSFIAALISQFFVTISGNLLVFVE